MRQIVRKQHLAERLWYFKNDKILQIKTENNVFPIYFYIK